MCQKKKNPVRSPAHKTRAQNSVCFVCKEWLKKRGIIVGAVLQVRVLNENDITGRCCKTTPQRRSLAAIYWMINHLINRVRDLLEYRLRAIARSVVDYNDLFARSAPLALSREFF
jgi:hypothetical protein